MPLQNFFNASGSFMWIIWMMSWRTAEDTGSVS